jgi:hypothetical protein
LAVDLFGAHFNTNHAHQIFTSKISEAMNIKKLIVGSLITAALIGACHTAEVQKTITENTYSDEKENIPTASETLQIKTHSDESEILNDKKSAATSTNSEMPVKDATVNESAIIKSPVELIDHPTKNTSESPVSHETGATIDLPYSTLAIESVKTVYSTSGMGTSVLKSRIKFRQHMQKAHDYMLMNQKRLFQQRFPAQNPLVPQLFQKLSLASSLPVR